MKPTELQPGQLYTMRGSKHLLEFERRVPPRHPMLGRNYFKVIREGSDISLGTMVTDAEVSRKVSVHGTP